MTTLRCLSGVGAKRPACFLVEAQGRRILLDLGEGPDPGVRPDLSGVGPVDAVVLSHAHVDHAGGLALLAEVGSPPVHATQFALDLVRPPGRTVALPHRGEAEVCGIRVETGRAGHAPGGMWVRLSVGEGLLYMGDHSTESDLYAFDPPPASGTIILDASYGVDDTPQAERRDALRPLLAQGGLYPVLAGGRGPEMAAFALSLGHEVAVDGAIRAMTGRLLGDAAAYVRPEAAAGLREVLERAREPGDPAVPTFAAKPNLDAGASAELARAWADHPARPPIVLTGYVAKGLPGATLVAEGRAVARRWNVHPRLSENVDLLRSVGARRVVPAFGDVALAEAWSEAFAPAEVTFGPEIPLS